MKQILGLSYLCMCLTILMGLQACKSSSSVRTNQEAPATSMLELLKRQPNLTIRGTSSANADIQIRGQKSITSNNQPLFILDGRRMGHDFQMVANLNPGDIRRIKVIRDPAELASYGVGASNGVIEIFTIR